MSKKNKLVKDLETEIRNLEFEVNHTKLANFKNASIRNIKIGGAFFRATLPYTLSSAIITGAFAIVGNMPFRRDDTKAPAFYMHSIDSNGVTINEKQYTSFEDTHSLLYYATAWQLNEDGSFSRNVKVYRIRAKEFNTAVEYLDVDGVTIDQVLGEPIRNYVETRSDLSKEEITEKNYVKVMYYDKDKNDMIIRKETDVENFAVTLVYIMLNILGFVIAAGLKDKLSYYNYDEAVKKIKEKYKDINIENIEKKLEIRRENYERLTR